MAAPLVSGIAAAYLGAGLNISETIIAIKHGSTPNRIKKNSCSIAKSYLTLPPTVPSRTYTEHVQSMI
jgi:hypothetical protein